MNKPPKPNTARPVTPSPITLPPVKETFRALDKLLRAAWVVLTLALVATFIPIKPARALKKPPQINDMAMLQWLLALLYPIIPSRIAAIITKYERIFHSDFKKAIAPSAI